MTKLQKIEQSGRSMVEMLGVLAIIGVLSVGGISGYSKAMAKFKLTKAQDQLTMLLMNIRTTYATAPTYTGLATATAIAYNLAPSDMIANNALHNAFGGSVVLGLSGNALQFSITFNGLGRETCLSLASSDWGSDGLVGMSINNAAVAAPNFAAVEFTPGGGVNGLPVPIDTAAANGNCSSDNAVNSITWFYY